MNQDQFWHLFSKNLAGEATADEKIILEDLMKAFPELSFSAQHLTDLWKISPTSDLKSAEEAFQKHFSLLTEEKFSSSSTTGAVYKTERQHLAGKKFLRLALIPAAFIIAIASAIVFWPRQSASTQPVLLAQRAEISTRAGNRTKLVLPDSSIVWLNAGSKLTYDHLFGISNRNTTLTGEAFFDVKKSTTPFIIHAKGLQIKVLGTAFNVKAYPGEEKTETSLVRGKVEITLDKRPGEKFILKPNEKLSIANDSDKERMNPKKQPLIILSELTHVQDDIILETSWVNNKLVFHEETFADVARKMERWYNVKIQIQDEKLAQRIVGGGPFENENIEQALLALQIAFNFHFTTNGNEITINP